MKSKTVEVVICRTCLGECNDYKSLYKQGLLMGEVTTLATLLAFCTNLEFSEDEKSSLRSFICSNCVRDLVRSYLFKKKVLHANEILNGHIDDDEAVIPEKNPTEEHVIVVNEAEADLQELAEAAQMKREQLQQEIFNVNDNEEYLQLTVLDNDDEGDNLHHNIVDQDSEEPEVVEVEYMEQDVAETTEIYHTTVIADDIHHIDDNEELEQDQHNIEDIEENGDNKVEYEFQVNDIEGDYAELLSDSQDGMSQHSFKRPMDDNTNSGSENILLNPIHKKRCRINSNRKPVNPDYQCKVCGKQLSNLSSYKYHMKLHSDETPYKCEICGEAFKTRNAYDGHVTIHNPNNPNTCKLCGKAYRQASSLRMHLLTHSGIKPFTCEVCGKSLTQKSGYKKHMLTHTGEKPFSCDICGKSFCISSNMLVHRRSHSDLKEHQCSECDKMFLTAEQLKRHSVIHSSERPFGCEICGKLFKRQSSWRSHMQTHMEDKTEKDYVLYSDEYDENNDEKTATVEVL